MDGPRPRAPGPVSGTATGNHPNRCDSVALHESEAWLQRQTLIAGGGMRRDSLRDKETVGVEVMRWTVGDGAILSFRPRVDQTLEEPTAIWVPGA